MDISYENFLNTFHREKQGTENEIVKFSDFFKIEESIFSEFDKKDISVTKLKDGKFFVSNCKDRGFFVEKNSNIDKIPNVSINYKKLQKNKACRRNFSPTGINSLIHFSRPICGHRFRHGHWLQTLSKARL